MIDRSFQPLLIGPTGEACLPGRVPVGSPPFSEAELQSIIEKHPGLLPVTQFDPLFGPPLCIGREVATNAGPLDNLYISPSGYITLVETKLWKAPDARRKVVAQIIDYTKDLTRWSYRELEERFLKYAKKKGLSRSTLHQYVRENTKEPVDEVEFSDAAARCLRNGRFLLLIVGDGIRESVEEMASYLQQTPSLQFTLGLVEISCYRSATGSDRETLLLVPHVVTKTAEVVRAVVQIEMSKEASQKVVTTVTTPSEVTKPTTASRLSKAEFYEKLASNAGKGVAERTEAFVDSLLEKHDALDEHFTLWLHRVRLKLPDSDIPPQPILNISKHSGIGGDIDILEKLAEQGYPASIGDAYWKGLSEIDSRAAGKRRTKVSGKKNLHLVVPKFEKLEAVITALVEAVQAAAADRD